MKILDIMMESATLLGLNKECVLLQNMDLENEQLVYAENPNLFSLFNLSKYSIREVCTNYVPMIQTVKMTTKENKIALSSLLNYIRIQNVTKDNEMVRYKIKNRSVIFEEDGEYEINYLSYPDFDSAFDNIDFLNNLSPDVLVLSLCAYYALAHGMFEEFEDLHDKYVEKAESLKSLRVFDMPARRWEWEEKRLLK